MDGTSISDGLDGGRSECRISADDLGIPDIALLVGVHVQHDISLNVLILDGRRIYRRYSPHAET
jgi:hypothetical protein